MACLCFREIKYFFVWTFIRYYLTIKKKYMPKRGEQMSEEKKVYCTQCGNQNDPSSKFCSNCGAKLERPDFGPGAEATKGEEGLFSGGERGSFFEKITDAEEEKPAPIPEIQINYGSSQQSYDNTNNYDNRNTGSNSYYNSSQPYYTEPVTEKPGGGNIGFAIASLVCGIISLLCCCLGLFSAVLAIAAIVLGIITLCFKYDGKGMAIAGIATGGVAIVIVIASFIISGTSFYNDLIYEFADEFYY